MKTVPKKLELTLPARIPLIDWLWQTPLAWLQLVREKRRFATAIAGISFAVLLMFMQLGFRSALFDSAARLQNNLHGDIFLISPQYVSMVSLQPFAQRRLYQALSVEGVAAVSPLYLDVARWRNPHTQKLDVILALGIDPQSDLLALGSTQNRERLKQQDTVLFDGLSREVYGMADMHLDPLQPLYTDVGAAGGGPLRKVHVGGIFSLGASFSYDGHVLMSEANFLRVFRSRAKRGLIVAGAIRLKAGASLQQVLADLKARIPSSDVRILSRQEFIALEVNHTKDSTPIGFIFGLGAALGFAVGTIIVYQILYADVSDHLVEYATLKAMGYRQWYLIGVVLQSALILAVLGYLPGLAISSVLYRLAATATLLPLMLDNDRIIFVMLLTILMCCISGWLAMRKLKAADPADIF
jgi:putative ABC transport system permease protein